MEFVKKIISVIAAISIIVTCALPCEDISDVNAATTGTLSEETLDFYDYWKDKYLVENPYVKDETQYYVFYGDKTYSQAGYEVPVTVSEAHGYGMLITASMADYDDQAKEIFDGMYRYYRAHLSEIGPNLMAWQQSDNGKALVDSSGVDSATDGDLDIAYSLLMADSLWGSNGEYNYKQTAIGVINDIMEYEVNQNDWVLRLGDWAYWSEEGEKYYSATRASDFIVQYMPIFAEVTGDQRWIKLYDKTYEIINGIVDEYGTGILPDFIIKDSSGKFIPAPANFLESEDDGNYYYNSCRTPWRISMDYLINGNEDAKKFADTITEFIMKNTKGDPWEIMAGYTPEGTAISDWNDLCFNSPFIIASACGDNSEWHDAVREMCLEYGEDSYYGDTITMLCLIVDDGCWIVPSCGSKNVTGDVNADGKFDISDLVAFRNWLLSAPDIHLAEPNAANMFEDDKLNIADLCMMKSELLKSL